MSEDIKNGGLSREEFMLLQEQLLQLRNKNYELQEELRKKGIELQNSSSTPKNEALQFASKLISRAVKKDEKDAEIEVLRRKLTTQEEEFKLQQTTLFEEMNRISVENETLKKQNSNIQPLESSATLEIKTELEAKITTLENKLKEMTEKAERSELLTASLEDTMLDYRTRLEDVGRKAEESTKQVESLHEIIKTLNEEKNEAEIRGLERSSETIDIQLKLTDSVEKCSILEDEIDRIRIKNSELDAFLNERGERIKDLEIRLQYEKEVNQKKDNEIHEFLDQLKKYQEASNNAEKNHKMIISEKDALVSQLELKLASKTDEITQLKINSENTNKKEIEERALLLETRYQLEIDDLKKRFEETKESLNLKITQLEEKLKVNEDEKKLALKKQSALLRELQKSLKEERRRADSYEKKNEEKAGWHVVQESDGNSSHTFDGNESISSLSAMESENVELINKLATLQKLNSENTDRLLQLESENSRLRREVMEKGELIENWIREKPSNNQSQSNNSSPRIDTGGFRRLLNTLGHDQSAQDLKEMNKKLQRMLEETLSKNILLQRDLSTLLERTSI